MGKFTNRLYRFMYGRYGTDRLGKLLLWVYVGVVIAYTVASLFVKNDLATSILLLSYLLISAALIFVIFFRQFSRNIQKRRHENDAFFGFFRLRRNQFRDRKTHVYRKCPHCRAVLRLPKAKGRHTVVCPRCKNRFEVKG